MDQLVLYNKIVKISFRGWLTLITLILLAIVIILAWPELVKAWNLLGRVDIWILVLLLPVQFCSYYATGGMIFSYLRAKGDLEDVSHWTTTRLALELNFVNHIFPSGGAAGFSYLAWVLKKHGISVSRSTMAQLVRYTLTFISFVMLLILSMIIMAIRHEIDPVILVVGFAIAGVVIFGTWLIIWLINNRKRMQRFSKWLTSTVNTIVRWFTGGKKKNAINGKGLKAFFEGIHGDFNAIRAERGILLQPFLWATITNIFDVTLIWIAFWALGHPLDPFLLFIAFGLASMTSVFAVTPGGTGVYETVMVAFLAASGVTPDVAIAGTLLARMVLLSGTILFGYVFYQLTVLKYGKHPANS